MRTHILLVIVTSLSIFAASACSALGPVPITGPTLAAIGTPLDPNPTRAPTEPPAMPSAAAPTPLPTATRPGTTVGHAVPALHQLWNSANDANQFNISDGVAVDAQGYLYVMDSGNDRIQKFDSNGKLVDVWGKSGQGDGELDCTLICMIAADRAGNVFVTDRDNDRVQKFDINGKFVTSWGGSGDKEGQFSRPFGIAVDGGGNVYVGDVGNHRVQVFDSNGDFLRSWGGAGYHGGQFSDDMADIAVDSAGNVYVTDRTNGAAKFDSSGSFLQMLGPCGDSQPGYPATGVAVDFQDKVYVFDLDGNSICKYSPDGKLVVRWDGSGSVDGPFDKVGGLAVDMHGNLYVGELFLNRVRVFRQPPQ